MRITYEPIGVVRSPFKGIAGMPVQPGGVPSAQGEADRGGLKEGNDVREGEASERCFRSGAASCPNRYSS